ncbi:MAG: sensor domain-containing diguanylate cyclase [Pyrinomonadaceae bacterium]
MAAPLPINENDRLAALYQARLLDTEPEREFDDVTLLASQICGTPIATISLIDESRQWFKAKVGIDATETPRDQAFCAHAILTPSRTTVIADATADERFANNPLVTGDPNIRFYAGTPLLTKDNLALGTLCVIDRQPRELNDAQLAALEALGRQLSLRLELRRTTELLQKANDELKNLSLMDELTGLYNRRGFFLHAEQQLKLYRSRRSERSLWLMVGDMDGLKHINDTYGHPEGSAAIKKMAEILMHTFRDADILARPGGDEFTALILNTFDDVARLVPERLTINLQQYNGESGKPYELGMSLGLVKVPFDEDSSIPDLVRRADAEMYIDKRKRKAERAS